MGVRLDCKGEGEGVWVERLLQAALCKHEMSINTDK